MLTRRSLLLSTAALSLPSLDAQQPRMKHGLNLSLHGPSSRAIAFRDAFLRARDGDIDPAGTRLFSDVDLPKGSWVVTWVGSGEVTLDGPCTLVSQAPGRRVYHFPERTNRPLFARWTGQAEAITVNIAGVAPGLFWPPFVDLLRFARPHALRTLDWTRTNEGARQRDARSFWEVPLDVQVALCERVGCGIYYTVPLGLPAVELETRFRALAPLGAQATVEVGNELWNAAFPAYRWLDSQDGRHVDAAAREIDRVFEVLGRSAPIARRYVGGNRENPWYLETLLDLLGTRVDAAGCAAYVGPKTSPASPQEAAQAAMSRVEGIRPKIQAHADICESRSVAFEVYEAGQSFVAGSPVVAAAQALPLMGEVYTALGAMLESCGVRLVHWYSLMTQQDGPTPPFGLLSGMRDPLMPKASAVLGMMLSAAD